jgi:hypothetical protein
MACNIDAVEIIHAGAAKGAIGHRKSRGLNNRGADAEAGAKAQHRAGVLGDIGLEQS